jgi:hypothetical protein
LPKFAAFAPKIGFGKSPACSTAASRARISCEKAASSGFWSSAAVSACIRVMSPAGSSAEIVLSAAGSCGASRTAAILSDALGTAVSAPWVELSKRKVPVSAKTADMMNFVNKEDSPKRVEYPAVRHAHDNVRRPPTGRHTAWVI